MVLEQERAVLALGMSDAAGRRQISALSMILTPFWRTVTRAFLLDLAVLRHGLVEGDVVGLPLERRLAGVDGRGNLLVDGAAVVVLALQTVRVEHLELVVAGEVNSAVAASLAVGLGHVGDVELDVELEVAEGLLGHDVADGRRSGSRPRRSSRRGSCHRP